MRRLVILFFFMISFSAHADWRRIAITKGGDDIYIDSSTMRKEAEISRAWVMFNMKKPIPMEGKKMRSVKMHLEFNCQKITQRQLYQVGHMGQLGEGGIVMSESLEGVWGPVIPGTEVQAIWAYMCQQM